MIAIVSAVAEVIYLMFVVIGLWFAVIGLWFEDCDEQIEALPDHFLISGFYFDIWLQFHDYLPEVLEVVG